MSVRPLWQFPEKDLKLVFIVPSASQKTLIQHLRKIISVLLKHQNGFVAFLYSIITFKGANNKSSMLIFNYFNGDNKIRQQNKQGK